MLAISLELLLVDVFMDNSDENAVILPTDA